MTNDYRRHLASSLPAYVCMYAPFSIVQDMEPEYIAVTENGNTAYVTLQVGRIRLTEPVAPPPFATDKDCFFLEQARFRAGLEAIVHVAASAGHTHSDAVVSSGVLNDRSRLLCSFLPEAPTPPSHTHTHNMALTD